MRAAPKVQRAVVQGSVVVVVVGAGSEAVGPVVVVVCGTVVVVRTTVECRPLVADVYPLEIVRVRRTGKAVAFAERRDKGANCQ